MHLANRNQVVPRVIGSNILGLIVNLYDPKDFDKDQTSVASQTFTLHNQEILVDKVRNEFAKVNEPVLIPGRSFNGCFLILTRYRIGNIR